MQQGLPEAPLVELSETVPGPADWQMQRGCVVKLTRGALRACGQQANGRTNNIIGNETPRSSASRHPTGRLKQHAAIFLEERGTRH
ncbi:hypothetical protein NDU88_001520 [Pleurodeles waltl]|uniref:Uncharacterized protein n=1 Tax=Pleurodeles waltl TaxID=8319 RepID=A0AAV7T0H9_PLEWA|nr:hypothetical protein NDU88_001520 [Pleurodeles waltl]